MSGIISVDCSTVSSDDTLARPDGSVFGLRRTDFDVIGRRWFSGNSCFMMFLPPAIPSFLDYLHDKVPGLLSIAFLDNSKKSFILHCFFRYIAKLYCKFTLAQALSVTQKNNGLPEFSGKASTVFMI
ncbi:hypothetical protein AWQ22_03340 [Picosynechococcus sp. PCC 7117]|nr:hypothetical protein AWQ22_03340 [Picosynechococcus sp. PCC 7117]